MLCFFISSFPKCKSCFWKLNSRACSIPNEQLTFLGETFSEFFNSFKSAERKFCVFYTHKIQNFQGHWVHNKVHLRARTFKEPRNRLLSSSKVHKFGLCSPIHIHWLGGESWLWHRVVVPARQATMASRPVQQPETGVNISPCQGLWFWLLFFISPQGEWGGGRSKFLCGVSYTI